MTEQKLPIDDKASRVAMVGIIAGLVLTAAGMMFRQPIFGGLGLFLIVVLVLLRRPIARLLSSR
ncbi:MULTISPECIES: hypothetical protein [Kaistia]|uniref:Uncharacterized protein n=1 Tax=Kaistia nematophila TaxID=2994654 RepID=A0A9X3ILT3_9HYPH|nr:hypothetical protein [Kaistia nematophila]MBN9026638.1 hypothetical protein [Hyphomicrobiales bacterium]MBN9058251.1 hypothetical protein [Hyphomicrobiales bacterium]MCX5569165.1 hypothetical protein [Kaistia nematophila]